MAKQAGCVKDVRHHGECYVGAKAFDCGDAQLIAKVNLLARLMPSAEESEALDNIRMGDAAVGDDAVLGGWLQRIDEVREAQKASR